MQPLESSYEAIVSESEPRQQSPLATTSGLPGFRGSSHPRPDVPAISEPSDASWVSASQQPWADARGRRRLPTGANVLVSVASLFSVLLFLLAVAVALQAFLLRLLQPNLAQGADVDQGRTKLQRQATWWKIVVTNCSTHHGPVVRPQEEELGPVHTRGGRSSDPVPTPATSFPLLPREAYLSRRRMFCVYNAVRWTHDSRRQRKGLGGLTYGIGSFPYHLCTDAVYCCAALGTDSTALKVDPAKSLRFADLRLKNPQLRLWLSVGGSAERSSGFTRIAQDDEAKREFVRDAVNWLQEFGFQGLLLHWMFPKAHERHFL
ncbi:unnamed protein product, partial [Ixodes hexagonus]